MTEPRKGASVVPISRKSPRIPASEAEWDEIEQRFQLGPDHKMLLAAGRQSWRRWKQIVERIDKDGLLIRGRYKNADRVHPLLAIEVHARAALVQILHHLDLPEES